MRWGPSGGFRRAPHALLHPDCVERHPETHPPGFLEYLWLHLECSYGPGPHVSEFQPGSQPEGQCPSRRAQGTAPNPEGQRSVESVLLEGN